MTTGGRTSRRLIGVTVGVAIMLGPAGGPAYGASPSPRPVVPPPVASEGRPLPEERGRQGSATDPESLRSATTDATRSAAGSADSDRMVGRLVVVGGADVLPDAQADTIAAISDRTVVRAAGLDRYATAVAVSQLGFPSGAPVALLATGENFPDGIAASAIAGKFGGPVLLSRRTTISQSVLDELVRLRPATVYVAGGPDVVADPVMARVRDTLPGAVVTRVYGQDRTATAAALARLLPTQHTAAFVATADNFPDALSGGPAAAGLGAPLLLTATNGLSAPAKDVLADLKPETTYVLGGAVVVSETVMAQISAVTGGTVVRLAGPDRFGTAAAVSARHFSPTTPDVVLATGWNFPDALTAGAFAASTHSPVLLGSGVAAPPSATVDEAKRVSWYLPDQGRVIRYIMDVHPDDEMSSRALLTPDPNRYDVYVLLTRGETTRYCNGQPVTSPWLDQIYVPQPQPTGVALSDLCKQQRLSSFTTFLSRTGIGTVGTMTRQQGQQVSFGGAVLPTPVHLDADGVEEPADYYDSYIGPDMALFVFDMGVLQPSEVLWALENVRAQRDVFATHTVEGDVLGAGYYNTSSSGYYYDHPDHVALYQVLSTVDLGLPGSQYVSVGHTMPTRTFGAWVEDYCAQMCHPGFTAPLGELMGNFQYSYDWLRGGEAWPAGTYDGGPGFSEYESFAKSF